jgi:ketosteroid isomerase-like protein
MSAAPGNGELIRIAFGAWEHGDSRPFFRLVSDQVRWRVIGTTPVSGTYHSKQEFLAATQALFDRFSQPIMAAVTAVHEAGDTVVLQWEGTSQGVNGRPYHQSYCWVLRLAGGQVVDVAAYLDTALLQDMFAD